MNYNAIFSPNQVENFLNGKAFWFYSHILPRVIDTIACGDDNFLLSHSDVEEAFAGYSEEELAECWEALDDNGYIVEEVQDGIRIGLN